MDVERKSSRQCHFKDLPEDIKTKVMGIHKIIKDAVYTTMDEDEWKAVKACDYTRNKLTEFCSAPKEMGEVGSAIVWKQGEDKYEVMIQATGHIYNPRTDETEERINQFVKAVYKKAAKEIKDQFEMESKSESDEDDRHEGIDVYISGDDAKALWDQLEKIKVKTEHCVIFHKVPSGVHSYYESKTVLPFDTYISEMGLSMDPEDLKDVIVSHVDDPIVAALTESADNSNVKTTMRQIAQGIIDDHKKGKPVSKGRVNALASLINQNFLPKWAEGYQSLHIILQDYQTFHTVEFKTPKMTPDFIERFIDGRETLKGFLHRSPDIKMRISPRVFETMKKPDDLFNFFKAAIEYYNNGVEKYGAAMVVEVKKLGHEMHHLIKTTKLSTLVSCPISLIFSFDDVDMSKKDTFKVDKKDIKMVNDFIKNIASDYADPAKDKAAIIKDMKLMVKKIRFAGLHGDVVREFVTLSDAVEDLYAGNYQTESAEAQRLFEVSLIDQQWTRNPTDQIKYLQEKFGVKKLKKIPRDIVAYVQIEGEAIQDANDKMMIASYCLGKIEIVEWYIELIDSGSTKYIVPHQKPYLVSLRTQLLAAYKKIMDTPIPKPGTRPIIDIQYPKGYEG